MSPKIIAITIALAGAASALPVSTLQAAGLTGSGAGTQVKSEIRARPRMGQTNKPKAVYPKTVKRKARFGLVWEPRTASLRLHLATGCLPTTARNLRDDFRFALDRSARIISIDGDFRYSQRSKIATRDCMNSSTRFHDFNGLEKGRYRIVRNGKLVRQVEFGNGPLTIGGRHRVLPVFPNAVTSGNSGSGHRLWLHSAVHNPVQGLHISGDTGRRR